MGYAATRDRCSVQVRSYVFPNSTGKHNPPLSQGPEDYEAGVCAPA